MLSLEKIDKMVKEAEDRELIQKVDKMTSDITEIKRLLKEIKGD